jgi:hypothetical protein
MAVAHDFAIGNAGTWLWMDLLLPLILLICVSRMKPSSTCM